MDKNLVTGVLVYWGKELKPNTTSEKQRNHMNGLNISENDQSNYKTFARVSWQRNL